MSALFCYYQELNRIMEKTKHLQLRFKPIGFELTDHDTDRTATVLSGRDYSRSIDIHEISHPECEAIGREIYDFILKDCLQGESRLKGVEVNITVNVDIKSQHQ